MQVLSALVLLLSMLPAQAQEKKLFNGFDGGMMVHTGFLSGSIGLDRIPAKGLPMGIGGVVRLHVGNHFRVGGGGYWKELLNRIRDIRASEKVFCRQILDIYATSVDYDPKADISIEFFKRVQNKIHYAGTGFPPAGGTLY